jgi:putative isomerase
MKQEIKKYGELILDYVKDKYKKVFREPAGIMKHKYIVPGSIYESLWDWDSWTTNIALREVASSEDIGEYEKGCVLNFLDRVDELGRAPILITPKGANPPFTDRIDTNVHKPCLAQHALFISEQNGDFEWLREKFGELMRFVDFYEENCQHESGLYFWLNDLAIGIDNDPCVFYRPEKSSASIYLNCLMYKELSSTAAIAEKLGLGDAAKKYAERAERLKDCIRDCLWDERNGFFYSADLNLIPIDSYALHKGCPRNYSFLLQKIDVWSGFMAMWAGIATPEQAERMVRENMLNERTFWSNYGIRSLSKCEKMYKIWQSGNPSCWIGPIWGNANYMCWRALLDYGYEAEALELAKRTVEMFGRGIEEHGDMHEYYHPDTGEGIHGQGFQSWNLLINNMIAWLEEENTIKEF